MGNLNTSLQILAGLNVMAVRRLKAVWSRVSPSAMLKFQELDDLFSPLSNFAAYRAHLAGLELSPLPILPYVGLFLKDVTYVFDGNPKTTSTSTINPDRLSLFGELQLKFKKYQSLPYQFEIDGRLEFFWYNMEGIMEDEELYQLSLKVYPVGTAVPDAPRRKSKSWLSSIGESDSESSIISEDGVDHHLTIRRRGRAISSSSPIRSKRMPSPRGITAFLGRSKNQDSSEEVQLERTTSVPSLRRGFDRFARSIRKDGL